MYITLCCAVRFLSDAGSCRLELYFRTLTVVDELVVSRKNHHDHFSYHVIIPLKIEYSVLELTQSFKKINPLS